MRVIVRKDFRNMWSRFCLSVVLLFCCVSVTVGQDFAGDVGGDVPAGRTPLVVLKQAAIEGQVFWIADKDGKQVPASDVKIVVRSWETQSKLFDTVTDKEGKYTLPNLDIGRYRFFVGKLSLELSVTEPDQPDKKVRRASKKIIVFIPEEMQ